MNWPPPPRTAKPSQVNATGRAMPPAAARTAPIRASTPLAASQRPEPEPRERARKNEEHLLRAHDGGPEAEPTAEEPAKPPGRRILPLAEPAQQEPEPAEEERQGEHVGAHLEGLLEEDRLPHQKQPRQKADPAIGSEASDQEDEDDRQRGQRERQAASRRAGSASRFRRTGRPRTNGRTDDSA